jgi:hypothetical protein
MKIKYSHGETVRVSDEDGAREIIDNQYPDAFYGEWEQADCCSRMLVWETELDSINDDGSNAICEIIV